MPGGSVQKKPHPRQSADAEGHKSYICDEKYK